MTADSRDRGTDDFDGSAEIVRRDAQPIRPVVPLRMVVAVDGRAVERCDLFPMPEPTKLVQDGSWREAIRSRDPREPRAGPSPNKRLTAKTY